MINATRRGALHLGQLAREGSLSRSAGRARGGLDSRLYAGRDGTGGPLVLLPPLIGDKDWWRIVTQCNRCVRTFFSAICIAAGVISGYESWVWFPYRCYLARFPGRVMKHYIAMPTEYEMSLNFSSGKAKRLPRRPWTPLES